MGPILKKLSAPNQSATQLADLLAKHIGRGENEHICAQACEALTRIRNAEQSMMAIATANLLRDSCSSCQTIMAVIESLRTFEQTKNI